MFKKNIYYKIREMADSIPESEYEETMNKMRAGVTAVENIEDLSNA